MAQDEEVIREFNELSMELGSTFAKAQSSRYRKLAKKLKVPVEDYRDKSKLEDSDTQGMVPDPE